MVIFVDQALYPWDMAYGPEATWGYMVKRISAHGGCLGGQRR